MAERRTADAEQAGDTTGRPALPLWVTIGLTGEDDASIQEYPTDDALRRAVDGHPLQDYIIDAIQEVRGEAASPDEAKNSSTGRPELPLWVTIGLTGEDDASIHEYPTDDALRRAVDGQPLQDYILAAIQEVRGEAASPDTT